MRDYTVVFDLDGTLVDTAPDLIRCANRALEQVGLDPVAADILRPVISHGARRMITAGLDAHRVQLADPEIDALYRGFIEHYEETIAIESRPFPGLIDVLDGLLATGARLAVCTNKLEAMSVRLLDELDMTKRFTVIAGRDTFVKHKPEPEHLTMTIARAGGATERAIMVGDSDVDIATAKAAGVPVIACTFGYSTLPVGDLSPDALIDHYSEFDAALTRALRRTA